MTNPPGMVVDVYGRADDVLFSLWNYTDSEIVVNLQAVTSTVLLSTNLVLGTVSVAPNSTLSTAGNTELATPTCHPHLLPAGVYDLMVQPTNATTWYQVGTSVKVGVPISPIFIGGGDLSLPLGTIPVCATEQGQRSGLISQLSTDPSADEIDAWLDSIDVNPADARDSTHFHRIRAMRKAAEAAQDELRAAVKAARTAGDSWTMIGLALGINRKSASQLFGEPPHD